MPEYIVWGNGQTKSLDGFATRDAALEETDDIESRWHEASEEEGAETWATVVTGHRDEPELAATDMEIDWEVANDANVWGFCALPIQTTRTYRLLGHGTVTIPED